MYNRHRQQIHAENKKKNPEECNKEAITYLKVLSNGGHCRMVWRILNTKPLEEHGMVAYGSCNVCGKGISL